MAILLAGAVAVGFSGGLSSAEPGLVVRVLPGALVQIARRCSSSG